MRNAIIRGMGNGYLQKQLVNDTVEIMSRKQGHENLIFNYFDQKNRKQGKVMKRKRRKIKLILLLLNCILCMILFGIVLVIYVKKVDEGTLGCGISVYGLDISQCTPEQAVKEIEETFRNKEVVFQENGQNVFETTVGNMGYVLDQSLLKKELLKIKKQRDQKRGLIEKRKNYSIEYEIKMEDKMEEVLNIEDFNLGERIESSDAYIDYDEQKESFILVDEIQGNQIDKKKLVEKVYNTLAEDFQEQLLSSRVEIEINRQVYQTAVSSEVSELNRKLEELNRQLLQYRTTTVTYIFGDTVEVLDNERISSWLIVSGDSISINEEEVIAFVKDLSSKYNTMYVPRSFRTSLGEEVTISGNEYGYRIDKDAELQKLLEDIKSGDDVRREPVYSKQGLERNGKDDLLGSYIEVSLDKQYLWLYKNGKLVTKTDIISGLPNEEFQTYRGAWPIAYKASPFTLSSDVYGYEIEVEYWMPFVYGQGLHDADWQDVFGGELYKTKGSHGCINLPKEQAKIIYDTIEAGYPIIIY